MKIPYKYKIGQKVTLVNDKNSDVCWGRDKYLTPLIGKEVTIIERGFKLEVTDEKFKACYGKKPNFLDKYQLTIYYYIEEDPYKEYTSLYNYEMTSINETCLSGEEMGEPFDEQFKTEDDYDVVPGETKVIEHIIGRYIESNTWKPCEKVNCDFTFSSYGTVIGLRKNYQLRVDFKDYLDKYPKCAYEVETFREFLCFYEPRHKGDEPTACGDARAYGNKHWTCIDDIWKELPENFVEKYVDDALNDPFRIKINYNPFNNWDTEQWLKKLEIYDEVKKLFDEKKPQAIKDIEEKEKELSSFAEEAKKYLERLTDEQKEQLKQML